MARATVAETRLKLSKSWLTHKLSGIISSFIYVELEPSWTSVKTFQDFMTCMCLTSDDRNLFTDGENFGVKMWDVETGICLSKLA